MAGIYATIGFAVFWLAVIAVAGFCALYAFCYLSACYRLARVCNLSWKHGESAWPKLDTRYQKARAFFRNAHLLMTGRVDAVMDSGARVPRWPWEPMPKS